MHKNSKPVKCIELDRVFSGSKEAEEKTGIPQGNISACCHGKLNVAGYRYGLYLTWKFITQEEYERRIEEDLKAQRKRPVENDSDADPFYD